jgi:hypothetical protein
VSALQVRAVAFVSDLDALVCPALSRLGPLGRLAGLGL